MECTELDEKLRSARMLTQMQKEQYLMLQNNIEESKRNRHDVKHHFIVLRGYLEQGNIKEALRYLDDFLEHTSSLPESFCGNYAVDSIIRYYCTMAADHQIPMEVSARLPGQLPLPELDLCTLLGNLLVNAAEACIRQADGRKFIRFTMTPAGGRILTIKVINSYTGYIRVQGGTFYSSKRDGEGIGTISIRHIVEKYQGVLTYDYKDGVFSASILLTIPESLDHNRE